MSGEPRLVIAGGGTGGHLFPGVAVAEALRRVRPDAPVLFIGTPRGLEARVVPARGFELAIVEVQPLKGKGALGAARGLLSIPRATWLSRRLLREFGATVALGVGGYSAGPALVAARTLGLKTAILEVNVSPGLTNRWLGRLVDRVYVHFRESESEFRAQKVRVTGTPVRPGFVPGPPASQGDTIVVLGGSQGARSLNRCVPEALALVRPQFRVVHQTGASEVDAVRERYARIPLEAAVTPFVDDVAALLTRARVVVCRAGAGTLAELSAVGRPAILVPYPFAAGDHQTENARALERAGAARMLADRTLTAETLAEAIRALLGDPGACNRMGEAALRLAHPDAADAIAADLIG